MIIRNRQCDGCCRISWVKGKYIEEAISNEERNSAIGPGCFRLTDSSLRSETPFDFGMQNLLLLIDDSHTL